MRLATLVAALLLIAPAAPAASPEEDYLVARDKDAAAVKALEDAKAADAKVQSADQAGLADLQKRLPPIVGPVAVRGFSNKARINLESLSEEGIDAGLLDGLMFAPAPDPQDGSRLVVTTRPLLQAWLKRHFTAPDDEIHPGDRIEDALRASAFYSSAFENDAAFGLAGEMETPKPAGVDFAFAGFGRRAQIDEPTPLTRLVVAMTKGSRVLIAEVETKAKIPEFPACKPVWTRAQAKAEALDKAYMAGGAKDEKLLNASRAANSAAERAWLACEGEHAKAAPFYPALKAQAADLAARMAGG